MSHLWWDWVWQRPQHLMTRFAGRGVDVTYVEEPRIEIGPTALEAFDLVAVEHGVRVARLRRVVDRTEFRRLLDSAWRKLGGHPFDIGPDVRLASLMFDSELQPELERRVRSLVRSSARRRPLVLWLYTPSVEGFVDLLEPNLVVYDVMDDLSAFRFAPPELPRQHRRLLERADLVFAGGPSLHRGVASVRPDAGLMPSGVDPGHFERARARAIPMPSSIASISRPIAGYVGVIDERLDLELVRDAARALPDWAWVMVGPVLKIDARDLPREPNLHFVGQVGYEDVPAYLGNFDVAIMPFALNDATRSISPTKTLEYLAAGLPVVSTAVPDVVALYGSVVAVVEGGAAFAAAVASARSDDGSRSRLAAELVRTGSWDRIADTMLGAVEARLAARGVAAG